MAARSDQDEPGSAFDAATDGVISGRVARVQCDERIECGEFGRGDVALKELQSIRVNPPGNTVGLANQVRPGFDADNRHTTLQGAMEQVPGSEKHPR